MQGCQPLDQVLDQAAESPVQPLWAAYSSTSPHSQQKKLSPHI